MGELQENLRVEIEFAATKELVAKTEESTKQTEPRYKRKGSARHLRARLHKNPPNQRKASISKSSEYLADIAEGEFSEEISRISTFKSSENLSQLKNLEEEEEQEMANKTRISEENQLSCTGAERGSKRAIAGEGLQQTPAWNISFYNDDPYETGRKLEQGLNLLSW